MIQHITHDFKESPLHQKIDCIPAVGNFITDGKRGRYFAIDDRVTEFPAFGTLHIFDPYIEGCIKQLERFKIGDHTFEVERIACFELYAAHTDL